ncbi:MAG TPA: alpha/beta hydrolase-fold protein [Solirubrobacteraceae bacterium]|nr:alpha/beta hydrolase-fold protein [Solirubrobacteraceae bacterium]
MSTARRLLLGGLILAWLVVGLYGVASYGHNYYVYRGYDPPHDPPHVAGGQVVTGHFYSRALHARRSYLVYLPPGYSPTLRYPVLYFMHGAPGSPHQFIDVANVGVDLDVAIARGRVRPFLLVMVDGRNGTYRSDTEWTGRYEQLVLETVHAVDAQWPTVRNRTGRAVTGNSEGAFGAMNVALHHLGTFGTVESWSGYFRAPRNGPFAHASPSRLRASSPADYVASLTRRLRRLPLHAFLYVGMVDADRSLTTSFAAQLHAAGARVRYSQYPGRHSWRLWRDTAPTVLAFAGRWFGR